MKIPSNIDRELFINWLSNKHPEIQITPKEIMIHDLWWMNENGQADTENKLWFNLDKGCYHAWKSGKAGKIHEFIMEVEHCSKDEANEILGVSDGLYGLEQRLDDFFNNPESPLLVAPKSNKIALPPNTYLINSLSNENPYGNRAKKYLSNRKIYLEGLMVCCDGEYRNRIIIPYYGKNGELLYYNGRALFNGGLRYKVPDKERYKIGKDEVLWVHKWYPKNSKVYLTEGEFDAMSLVQAGFNAAACGGKNVSPKQIELLRDYHIVLAFDCDKAGEDAFKIANKIVDNSVGNGIKQVGLIRPPVGYKDWNEMLVKHSEKTIANYINKEEKVVEQDTFLKIFI